MLVHDTRILSTFMKHGGVSMPFQRSLNLHKYIEILYKTIFSDMVITSWPCLL